MRRNTPSASLLPEKPVYSNELLVQIVFFRHTYRQLLKDLDIEAIVYRLLTDILMVKGATHVALRLYKEDAIDAEYGYSWRGSYKRYNVAARAECVVNVVTMPSHYAMVGVCADEKRNRTGVKWLDLWRTYRGQKPKGITCITWVQHLLEFDEHWMKYTMSGLEELLLEMREM